MRFEKEIKALEIRYELMNHNLSSNIVLTKVEKIEFHIQKVIVRPWESFLLDQGILLKWHKAWINNTLAKKFKL